MFLLHKMGYYVTFQKFKSAIFKRIKKIKCTNIKRGYIWKKRNNFFLPIEAFGCTQENYSFQKSYKFHKQIKFSILVPLYNTPEQFLKEMIASVLFQTYENWELCLADGSDKEHSYIENICKKLINKDKRIKYLKLECNNGISENTNACIKMATGNYISLFDHDDLLHPYALFETMKAICEKNADFIYTDEAIFQSPHLHKIKSSCSKPDFAPDFFHSTNYLCHFSSFKKSLLDKTGLFNSKTDGAQDFDLFLRFSEHTNNIVHVPKCLYYWRASSSSTASGIQTKSYAIEAGKLALENHFKRGNIPVTVSVYNQVLYKISYLTQETPLVSIIILNENTKQLVRCIESIKSISSFSNYEIIIINTTHKSYISKEEVIKTFTWKDFENHTAMYNFAAKKAHGDYIIFLDCHIKVKTANWIDEMLMFAKKNNTGAVGAKLLFKNNTILNNGYIQNINKKALSVKNEYPFRDIAVQNYDAITAKCMMISKKLFFEYDGFSEKFEKEFYDVDLCLRLRKDNYLIVWTPFSELYICNKIKNKLRQVINQE